MSNKEKSQIYQIIEKLCKEKGTSPTALCTELTGSRGNLPTWQKGSINAESLKKIADYFDVSTDYLLGRTDKQKLEPESIKDSNNTGGLHMFDFTIPVTTDSASGEQQQEISNMLSDLSPRERNKLRT